MIWFFLPAALVITNDMFAYICGIAFGRTQLIKLSPKKTAEGFVGAWIMTILFAMGLTSLMSRSKYFICPVNVRRPSNFFKRSTILICTGPRREYLHWPCVRPKPGLLPSHIHPATVLFPAGKHSVLRHNRTSPNPRFLPRHLRLVDCTIRRFLRIRTEAHVQDQGLWPLNPRSRRYN